MPVEYRVNDSGKRQEFGTGAKRDTNEGKGRYDLISPIALYRLALRLEQGAKKYDERNWEQGMPLTRYLESAVRHLYQWLAGDGEQDSEDHLGAAMFNVMALIHTEEMIERGLLPVDLDNRPSPMRANRKILTASVPNRFDSGDEVDEVRRRLLHNDNTPLFGPGSGAIDAGLTEEQIMRKRSEMLLAALRYAPKPKGDRGDNE